MAERRTLVLLHPVLWAISEDEARGALSEDQRAGLVEFVTIALPFPEHPDWEELKRAQEQQYRTQVAPRLSAHPDVTLAYFGAAPIPLAVHLGFLIPTWARVEVYQHHHEAKTWAWQASARTEAAIRTTNVPTDENTTPGDAVVRVSLSFPVLPVDTRAVARGTAAEVELRGAPLGIDSLASSADLEHAAGEILAAILAIMTKRPKAERLHLFYAGPVGVAFRLGTLLNPTVVPAISLYQYTRTSEPHYERVLELLVDGPVMPLTADELGLADRIRLVWRETLAALTQWARDRRPPKGQRWLAALGIPGTTDKLLPEGWKTLGVLGGGRFRDSTLASTRDVEDGFRFDGELNQWELGDDLLLSVARRLVPDDWPRAARLFFLHEALHLDAQKVTSDTAWRIGQRHPMLAEEFDYRADVWALLHELSFSWERGAADARPKDKPVAWIRRSIEMNTEVIWAFVSDREARQRLELRRLRRFLTWYWLHVGLSDYADLGSAVRLLLDKPVISLSGPYIHSRGGRTYVLLDTPMEFPPEVAVVIGNRLKRPGTSDGMDLGAAIEALRGRDPAPLQRALRGLHDQLDGATRN